MFDVRAARDTDDLRTLWNTAFLPDEAFFSRDYRPERALVIADREKPVSMLHILPRTILLGELTLQAGYIMGVVTDPAHRRRGLAGTLIAAAVQAIEAQGFDCAMLIPASGSLALYYQRFGLILRGYMPRAEGSVSDCRPAGAEDIPTLSALYDAAFPYRVERTAFEWGTILLEYTVLLGEGGYTAGDERGIIECVPVRSDAQSDERAACIRPFTAQAGDWLTERRPYINLLYT